MEKLRANQVEVDTRELIIEQFTIRETNRAKRPAELEYEIIDSPKEDG